MKADDLQGKTIDELKDLLLVKKKELLNLRFQRASGELENTALFKEVKKTIARIQTFLSSARKAA